MALTYEQKQEIAKAIEIIWSGAVHASPEQITDEVADIVTNVIHEIASATTKIKYIYGGSLSILYMMIPVTGMIAMLEKFVLGQLLGIWFREIGKQIGLRAATVTATSRWRSPLEIALMQL